MLGLAHSLNMTVVAEGIETAWEAETLRSFGCDMFQGYYYGRPGPLEAFLDGAQLELDFDIR